MKWDVSLNVSVLVISSAFACIGKLIEAKTAQEHQANGYARITVNGQTVKELSLDEEHREELITEYGRNIVWIHQGAVYMEEADCPDQYCVKQHGITSRGEVIVCLPNRVVVTISQVQDQTESSSEPQIDAVAE